MQVLLSAFFNLLAFAAPIVLPLAAHLLTSRFGFWRSTAVVMFVVLISLPISCLLILLALDAAIFTYDHVNPGVGVAAIGVITLWAMVFVIMILVTACRWMERTFFKAP